MEVSGQLHAPATLPQGKNPVKKWPHGKPRRWEDNINICLREIDCDYGRWMELAQDHVQWMVFVLTVLNIWVKLPQS
jgi:hypothetical protein